MSKGLEILIEQCRQNNQKAQKALYDQFSGKMFAVCLRYSSNYEEAQDSFQEGFVTAFQKIGQFKNAGSFEGWLRRIMVNGCLEKYRKRDKVIRLEDERAAKLEYEDEDTNNLDTNHQLNLKEMLELIQTLPEKYRTIFNMYVLDGYTHREIAEELNISEGTSKSALSRSRKILQNNMKKKVATTIEKEENVFRSAL